MTSSSFQIKELELPGVFLIQPKRFEDSRGFFMETFHQEVFTSAGINVVFVQDNISYSKKNVLRGLHFQKSPHAQAKLVRCVTGEIYDVVADHNPDSVTFGKHIGVTISGDTQTMLYIPARYAHGFCVLSDEALVEYKVDNYYHAESAHGVRYDDPVFGITWPVHEPILSEQDKKWPLLASVQNQ